MTSSPHFHKLLQITQDITKSCNFPERLCRLTLELAVNLNNYSVFGQMGNKLAGTHKLAKDYALC